MLSSFTLISLIGVMLGVLVLVVVMAVYSYRPPRAVLSTRH